MSGSLGWAGRRSPLAAHLASAAIARFGEKYGQPPTIVLVAAAEDMIGVAVPVVVRPGNGAAPEERRGGGVVGQEDVAPACGAHSVYLVRCAGGALYAGYTTDVARRVAAHNAGRGSRYTRSRRPVVLIAAWPFASRGEALRAEALLKRLPPAQKRALVIDGVFLGRHGQTFPERLTGPGGLAEHEGSTG